MIIHYNESLSRPVDCPNQTTQSKEHMEHSKKFVVGSGFFFFGVGRPI